MSRKVMCPRCKKKFSWGEFQEEAYCPYCGEYMTKDDVMPIVECPYCEEEFPWSKWQTDGVCPKCDKYIVKAQVV